jgi:hypothetical protein
LKTTEAELQGSLSAVRELVAKLSINREGKRLFACPPIAPASLARDAVRFRSPYPFVLEISAADVAFVQADAANFRSDCKLGSLGCDATAT